MLWSINISVSIWLNPCNVSSWAIFPEQVCVSLSHTCCKCKEREGVETSAFILLHKLSIVPNFEKENSHVVVLSILIQVLHSSNTERIFTLVVCNFDFEETLALVSHIGPGISAVGMRGVHSLEEMYGMIPAHVVLVVEVLKHWN